MPKKMGRRPKKENRIWIYCIICGKEFWKYKSNVQKGYKNKFCSLNCYNKFKKGKGNPNWKGHERERQCHYCKKKFKIIETPSVIKRKEGKYCSRKCQYEGLKKRLSKQRARKILNELKHSNFNLPDFAKQKGTTERILKRMLTEHFPDEYETTQEIRRLRKDEWYRKGRAFERETRIFLQKYGYLVMPSPRSAGPADLLAVKMGKILLVQCKLYGQLRKEERLALNKLSEKTGGIPILATKDRRDKEILFWLVLNKKNREKFKL